MTNPADGSTRRGRRAVLGGGLALAAAPAIITTAHAQQKVHWKLQSHYPKVSASFSGNLKVLAKELEERTDGRFQLELLGAGEIAKGAEIFNVVRRGVVQMGTALPDYNLAEAPLMGQMAGVPGTLREPWQMMHMVKNLGLEDAVNEELRPKGIFIMGEKAYPTEMVLKKPIAAGTDLSSVKVRAVGNMLEFLAAAGFAPQPVDGPELYQALATGVVEGAYWGAAQGALSMKFWEVAPIHMKPALLIGNVIYQVNLAAYEALPADLRRIFRNLVEERYFRHTVEYEHGEAIALRTGMEKMGVKVERFPDDVMVRLAEASKKILDKEMAKGPKAHEFGEKLVSLMKDLGYV